MGICATPFIRQTSQAPCLSWEEFSDDSSEGPSDPGITERQGHVFEPNELRAGSGLNTLSLLTLCDAIAGGRVAARTPSTVAGFSISTSRGWWEDNGLTAHDLVKTQRLAKIIDEHVVTLELQSAPLEEKWQHVQELGTGGVLAEWKKSDKHIALERLRMEIGWLITARKSLDR